VHPVQLLFPALPEIFQLLLAGCSYFASLPRLILSPSAGGRGIFSLSRRLGGLAARNRHLAHRLFELPGVALGLLPQLPKPASGRRVKLVETLAWPTHPCAPRPSDVDSGAQEGESLSQESGQVPSLLAFRPALFYGFT
jgi:hypothetical protein